MRFSFADSRMLAHVTNPSSTFKFGVILNQLDVQWNDGDNDPVWEKEYPTTLARWADSAFTVMSKHTKRFVTLLLV
jgi:hypothetical protein